MAMIETRCKSCGALIRGPEELEGKELKCPKCKAHVILAAAGGPGGPAPKPDSGPEESDDLSAGDLLAEIKGTSGAASPSAGTDTSSKPGAKVPSPSPKRSPKPPIPMAPPPERGLPINLIVSVIGIVAVAITVYILWQKNKESTEDAHTRTIAKRMTTEIDDIRAAIRKAGEIADKGDAAGAKEALDKTETSIARVLRDIDLELGAATTEFSVGQRSTLIEDAEGLKTDVRKVLDAIEQQIKQTEAVTEFVSERKEKMEEFGRSVEAAKRQIEQTEYAAAKRALTRAKSNVEELLEDIEDRASEISDTSAKKKLDACKVEAEKQLEEIRKLLGSDEIVHGAMGKVKYKGKWVTPEEMKKAEAAAQRPAPKKGTLAKKIAQAFKPDPSAMEWMIDDMNGPLRWVRLNWGDEAEVTIAEVNQNKVLNVRYKPGTNGKVALSRGGRLDITSRSMLVVDVENHEGLPVNLCLAIWTDRMYESQAQSIPSGKKTVSFSLIGATYKCDKDNWQSFSHEIANPETVNQIVLMIYPTSSGEGRLTFDNVRMISK